MFTDLEKQILTGTWRQIVPLADSCVDVFYRRLFELRPEYRTLFPLDMSGQKRKFLRMLAFVVKSLDFADTAWRDPSDPREDLLLVVLALGRRHDEFYRIPPDAYGTFGEALLFALEQVLGPTFNAEARATWLKLYGALALAMRLGASTVDEQADAVSAEEAQQLGEQAFYAQATASSDLAQLGYGQEHS